VDLEVCGSAGTLADAVAGIAAANPQLLILDIRLPDGTGFEILQALDEMEEPRNPWTIFLTAYDEYAVEAFQVAALDYLLKPVSQERFSAAIGRARERIAAWQDKEGARAKYMKRFLVERRTAAYLLPVEEVDRIEAFAVRATMDGLEKRLDPTEFARVSRSWIVRVAAIREVRLSEDHNYVLILSSGDEVGCSKRYWTAALEKLL
jgi:two-component system LytT family response regulator